MPEEASGEEFRHVDIASIALHEAYLNSFSSPQFKAQNLIFQERTEHRNRAAE
jgi:hypothetical protein